jgi:hypothetical protein
MMLAGNKQVRTFCYTKVFHNHYQYWHVVESNNNKNNNHIQPLGLEDELLAKSSLCFHLGGHWRQHAGSIKAFCGKANIREWAHAR